MVSLLEKYKRLLESKGFHNLHIYINEANEVGGGVAYGEQGALKIVNYINGEWTVKDESVCVNFFTFESVFDRYIKYLEKNKDDFSQIVVNIDEVSQFGDGIVELKNGTPSGCWFEKAKGEWF